MNIKQRLVIYLYYALFWLGFFFIGRLLFLIFNMHLTSDLGIFNSLLTIIHGFKLDLSMTGYILMLTGLLFVFSNFFGGKYIKYFIHGLTFILLFVFSFIIVADLELYKHWGFRMDSTPLMYILTPQEALASLETWWVILLFVLAFLYLSLSIIIYKKIFFKKIRDLTPAGWQSLVLFIFLSAFMILPARGGISIAPLNTGSVYFSKNNYANHAAVNVVWNVGYSLVNLKTPSTPVKFYDNEEAQAFLEQLYENKGDTEKVLNTESPNIIMFIIESFTSKLIEILGGEKGITPCINKLAKEGILFDNFYASGDRSAKGLVSILSGYPALPLNSIITFPQKTQNLPFITHNLKDEGYNTSFYYGGDIDFANFRSYFINAGFDRIITKEDFDQSEITSNWGVHDHIVIDRCYEDLYKINAPFFNVIFTLSSHEPFDVPMETVIEGEDRESLFCNSAYYTDKSIGRFMENAKSQSWWENTLIILVADHGHRLPGNSKNYEESKFMIPMLWLGGALNVSDTVISSYSSQTDIPRTILNQMNIDNDNYKYSRDIFSSCDNSFAFYSFNNGFGFITDSLKMIYDIVGGKYILNKGKASFGKFEPGKAYLQVLNSDFINK